MYKHIAAFMALAVGVMPQLTRAEDVTAPQPHEATAIDVALEPDAKMIQHADAANADLLKVFPKGFALDATHQPHITLVQRFVRTVDLPKVYSALSKVFARSHAASWTLQAFKYYYIPAGSIGVAGIVVRPTADLVKLQHEVIDAIAPFTVKTGNAAAFYTTPSEPDIQRPLVEYVSTFVPNASGKHFNPHVTTGIGPTEYLNKLLSQPFTPFTFSPAGASIYQLGDFGAARKKLKLFPLAQ